VGSPGSARRECRWDDRRVITADDVDTLLFDVLGTVVDEAGSMRAELAAALDQADAGRQAAAWARRFAALVSSIGEGAPWRSTDDLNAEALAGVLRDGPQLPEATVRQICRPGGRMLS
jgi:2-haloacid dehalogenase